MLVHIVKSVIIHPLARKLESCENWSWRTYQNKMIMAYAKKGTEYKKMYL